MYKVKFYRYWKDNKFVLLHHFVKKTQKTPPREIEKARAELKDFLERYGDCDDE
jgi:phage-related protein